MVLGDFLVHEENHDAGISNSSINTHEDTSHNESNDCEDDGARPRRTDLIFIFGSICDDEIADQSSQHSNEEFANHYK